ncbi:MAG: CPBP family intramembrane metalloprotease [Bacilli bacterium]|nr:CPBP family intramembrane metalloprotease [Bacilli bacterium]
MERRKTWDIVILLLVFVLSVSFPIGSITNDIDIILWVKIGLLAAYIVFAILFIYFTKIAHFFQGKVKHKNAFLLSPLFLVAFCNLFFFVVFRPGSLGKIQWDLTMVLSVILSLLTAVSEELVFRYIIQKNLRIQSKFVKILVASSLFALCHILTVISGWNLVKPATWNWFDLSIIAYTFFIGVCLGFLYEYTNNIVLPIAFHFIFNFINDNLFYVESWTLPYLFNCLGFALFGILYILLFYFVFTKREER